MSVWSLTAAAVLTGLTVGAQQSPPTALVTPPPPAITVEARQEDSSQRVSVDFNHAPVSDVLDWLSKNGASFVAADSEIPKDTTITMSIKDQPMDEVVDALASALGGHWERNGGVRVFRHGGGGGFGEMRMDGNWTTPQPPTQFKMAMPPGKFKTFKDGNKVFVTPDGDNVQAFGDDNGKFFVMPDMKNFQMPDMKDLPNLDKLRSQLKEQLKDVPGMSPEAMQEMEKAIKESQAEMMKSGDEMKISEKAMLEAQKAMEKARKEHPEAFKGDGNSFFIAPRSENGRTFTFTTPEGGRAGGRFNVMAHGQNLTKLLGSLSPEQKELNRRQGYLRPSDLTQSQREMLGISGDAKNWTIKINKDGEEVTIKSDR